MTNYSTHSHRYSQKGQAEAAGATGKNYVDEHVEQVNLSPVRGPIFVELEHFVQVSTTLIDVYSTTLVVVVDIFRGLSQLFNKVIYIVSLIACIGCCNGEECSVEAHKGASNDGGN